MTFRFTHHYSRDEARALLPQVRLWLTQLLEHRRTFEKIDQRLGQMLGQGNDLGGKLVNEWITALCELKTILQEFQQREIQIKDVERGLIDFPAIIGGREVFLCWEQDEEDIEFWHDLETGYAGRERL
jgi:hypothetical protein